MTRAVRSFGATFLSALSLLLFLATGSLWASSYWMSWSLRTETVAAEPGDTWGAWWFHVSAGGVAVERTRLLGARPHESPPTDTILEALDWSDIKRLAARRAGRGGRGRKVFLDSVEDIERTIGYNNPVKLGMAPQMFPFVTPYDGWPVRHKRK
jgi:hypothetical protein